MCFMKQLMKNIFYLLIAVFVLSACSEEDKSVSAPEIIGAKLISFGFYVEDNEGILDKDYVVEGEILQNDIDIKIPSKIDKSALIARFTTSVDNPMVMVNGKAQVSQQTVNNFTVPVDFVLTNNSQNNRKYTVRIKRPVEWIRKNRFSDFGVSESILKVNPVNNIPYVMGIKNNSNSNFKKAVLLKYEDDKWSMVGDTISDGRVSDIDFTFDATGNPYVAYSDYNNTVKQSATVKYFDGDKWVEIGRSFNDVRVQFNSICFDASGALLVCAMNSVKGAVERRAINISTYTGTQWITNNTIVGREYISYNIRTLLKNGIVYLAVFDYNNSSISVYKYQDALWTTLAYGIRHENATSVNNNYDLDMTVDSKGNVYVLSMEIIGGGNKLVTHKFLAATNAWSVLPPIDLSANPRFYSIALSPNEIPHIVYRNNDNTSSFVYLDSQTQVWTSPFVFNSPLPTSGKTDFDFASNGIGYAVSPDANSNLVMWEYTEEE